MSDHVEREADTLRMIVTVLAHPGFHSIERQHSGHNGGCPQVSEYDGLPCTRFAVGIALREGVCTWSSACDPLAAIRRAHAAIHQPPHAFVGPGGHYNACEACGVAFYAHEFPATRAEGRQ